MPAFPYTTVPGSIKPFMEKIRTVRIPEKASRDWLPSVSFKSSNHRTLLTVLKFIGFINQSGSPTELWRAYRGPSHENVLADAVRNSYSAIFSVHVDPWKLSNSELTDFFNSKSSAAEGTISKMVDTFKALCSLSNFSSANPAPTVNLTTNDSPVSGLTTDKTINLNINIELPVTDDDEVYERILKAIRKILID